MAKTPQAAEQKAVEKAQKIYEELTRSVRGKPMSAAEAEKHLARCKDALLEKRYAVAVEAAVRANKPVPQKKDIAECRELMDKPFAVAETEDRTETKQQGI